MLPCFGMDPPDGVLCFLMCSGRVWHYRLGEAILAAESPVQNRPLWPGNICPAGLSSHPCLTEWRWASCVRIFSRDHCRSVDCQIHATNSGSDTSQTLGCFCFPGLFHAFDENRDNHIDFKEISCGLSACCRGPIAERQKCKCLKSFT